MGEFPPHSKYNAGGSSRVNGNSSVEYFKPAAQQYSAALHAQGRSVGAYEPTTARPNLRINSQKPNAGRPRRPSSASSSDSWSMPTPVISGRVDKTPSPKKHGGKARSVRRDATIKTPLSRLAAQFPDVDIADIDSFVSRSTEDRHIELGVGKNPGKVKRPMNAFMLYRKAYQKLAKTACSQNNHQYVSQICGDSWAIEPMSVRDRFNAWAVTERVNHNAAHPEYKFSSTKVWDRRPIDGEEAEFENMAAEVNLGLNFGGASPSSPFASSYRSQYGPYYGLPPSRFQVAPVAINATSFQSISALRREAAFNPMAVSQPTYAAPMTGPFLQAASESPFFGTPAPTPSFVSLAESPMLTAPTGNSFLGASAQGPLVNASPEAIVGIQQAEPAMPTININRPPPLPTTEIRFNADDYPHPNSMEISVPLGTLHDEEEPMLDHFDNELRTLETANDDMQAGRDLLNTSRDWVPHPPVHDTLGMTNGLGQERSFPGSILDSGGHNTISV
ncbi:HMG-box protein STE11 [Ceratocystis platani]|uniref:HMG-box protein STE11 n=1 Tax=Ceratocystis fimbriata f. sp. platani TaxID=88771 RepID=A0A0F8BMD7_CERFI|nr:HMG-box protein STE11 [Ceratocystis platani]